MSRADRRTLDLSVGQPDYSTPEHVKAAGIGAIRQNITRYTPQPGFQDLRKAIAGKFLSENGFEVQPEQVVVTCGAKYSLYETFQCTINTGDEVVLLSPYWSTYRDQIEAAGGVPVPVPVDQHDGFEPDVDRVAAAVTSATRAIVINSPCNPTGSVFAKKNLLALAELARSQEFLIISDETYERIVYDGLEHHSIASLAPDLADRIITVNSVSKTHAMTGWRIGYAAMSLEFSQKVAKLQSCSTSGPCSISQRAALAAITGTQAHVAEMVADYTQRRDFLLNRLAEIESLSCSRPQGTFYLFIDISRLIGTSIRSQPVTGADSFTRALNDEAGIRVLSGSHCGSDRHIRLSFATCMKDLEEAMDRLVRVLDDRTDSA